MKFLDTDVFLPGLKRNFRHTKGLTQDQRGARSAFQVGTLGGRRDDRPGCLLSGSGAIKSVGIHADEML